MASSLSDIERKFLSDHVQRLEYMATLDIDKFMDYSFGDFLLVLRAISPQRFGRLFQKYLIHKKHFQPSVTGIGDAYDPVEGVDVEIKVSIPKTGSAYNFVQIRPHEVCDLVLFGVSPDGTINHWRVPHEQVAPLMKGIGTSAHGTLSGNNPLQEYAIRFKPGSAVENVMNIRFAGTGIDLEA